MEWQLVQLSDRKSLWAKLEHLVVDLNFFSPHCRNDFTTTQQAVEVDSIVLTCPEVPGSNLHKYLCFFFF